MKIDSERITQPFLRWLFFILRQQLVPPRLAQLSRLPVMRQQLRNITGPLRRQAREDVLQISIRIMPVESR